MDIQPEAVITWGTGPAVAMSFVVNFGVFAGRHVSQLELERLGGELLGLVDGVAVVSEHRLEFAPQSSIDLHQVRVEIDRDEIPADEQDIEALRMRVAGRLEEWLHSCLVEISGQEFTNAELDARDAVVEGVLGAPGPQQQPLS